MSWITTGQKGSIYKCWKCGNRVEEKDTECSKCHSKKNGDYQH